MDLRKIPGKQINIIGNIKNKEKPTISIITPFYNGGATLEQTANSIFSQTYPFFEWVIIDDGSKDKDSLNKLKEIEKKDSRVKVYHKENGGPSVARDFGLTKTSESVKYILFLDCDDIIENTELEIMYWTLETHPEASFVYPPIINFGSYEYYWEPYFTIERELVENVMCINTMIKKSDLEEVGGFGIKEKAMHEDWNLWLKLLAKKKIPIRINAPVFWYRTSKTGELSRANNNRKRAMKLINKTVKTITEDVEVIQFPRKSSNIETNINIDDLILPEYKTETKKTILFLLDNIAFNQDNLRAYEVLKRLSQDKYNVIVLSTEPSINHIRQDIQEVSTEFYDMSNFLDTKDYKLFIEYIVKSRNVDTFIMTGSKYSYAIAPLLKQVNSKIKIINLIEPNNVSTEIKDLIDYNINLNEEKSINKTISSDSKQKLKKKNTIISFIGDINYETRPKIFVYIAEKMILKNPNLQFIISGYGELKEEIQTLIANNKNIKFIEPLESDEELYKISDIIVACGSNLGISLVNYYALENGIPVVSVDLENQNLIINEETGKLVEYNKCDNSNSKMKKEAEKYIIAINQVLNNIDIYRRNIIEITNAKNTKYNDAVNDIEKIIAKKAEDSKVKDNLYFIYAYLMENYRKTYDEAYLKYYDLVHHINPEIKDFTKQISLKKKIRSFSIKYYIETPMQYVYKTMQILIEGIKNIGIFLLKLIPLTLTIGYLILRFVRIILSKIKSIIIKK